ncbi:TPA: hypothetical protein DD394_08705 [bacterium UBP9_UBA11836]|nr:hypothetical protein [bacterium UBP9_UBA11836]
MKGNQGSEAAFPDSAECQECVDKLLEYEDGLLSETDASKLKRHLEECSRCSQYQHSLSEVWNNLDKAFPQELEPSSDFKVRFWKKVGQEANKGKIISLETELKAKSKYLHYWKTFTAAASLAVVGGAVLWSAFASNGAPGQTAANVVANTSASVGRESVVHKHFAQSKDSGTELSGDEPYYTDYIMADEFNSNANEDLSNSVIYADYKPDYVMSQELLDIAFDEAADSGR